MNSNAQGQPIREKYLDRESLLFVLFFRMGTLDSQECDVIPGVADTDKQE